jgi:hypothetical protein
MVGGGGVPCERDGKRTSGGEKTKRENEWRGEFGRIEDTMWGLLLHRIISSSHARWTCAAREEYRYFPINTG